MAAAPVPSARVGEEDAPASAVITAAPEASSEAGAPVGPSADEEAAFLAEQREHGYRPAVASTSGTPAPEADDTTPLPPLDDLVNRIPAATRELMDELFRARFVTVKRVPPSALKN